MRGEVDPQSSMFHYFSVESRIPADHPLRRVKKLAESALSAISAELDGLYARTGRPSIPPERLLKAQLLIAFYSVRSDRLFCEQLDYNLLFRWFLDLDLESGGLDQSNFSRLRERLVETDIARRFFDEVVRLARKDKLLSSDHFTVDGTLIDAWASFKSFKRKDDDEPPRPGGRHRDGGFQGREALQRHPPEHHRSGREAHEKRQRPAGQTQLRRPCAHGEPERSVRGSAHHRRHPGRASGGPPTAHPRPAPEDPPQDPGCRQGLPREGLRPASAGAQDQAAHIARIDGRKTPGLDGRTTCTEGYKVSQRKRKRIEEIFGWLKTVGGMRKTRFIGEARTQIAAYLSAAAYNLLRIAKLQSAGSAA
jgi:transposase